MVASALGVLEAGEDTAGGALLRDIPSEWFFGGLEEGSWQLLKPFVLELLPSCSGGAQLTPPA